MSLESKDFIRGVHSGLCFGTYFSWHINKLPLIIKHSKISIFVNDVKIIEVKLNVDLIMNHQWFLHLQLDISKPYSAK